MGIKGKTENSAGHGGNGRASIGQSYLQKWDFKQIVREGHHVEVKRT